MQPIVLTANAAALGAESITALTKREWLFGQALMGLAALPGLPMRECIPKAIEAADSGLNALTAPPPPTPSVAPSLPVPSMPVTPIPPAALPVK